MASSPAWSEGGSDPTNPIPACSMRAWLLCEFCPAAGQNSHSNHALIEQAGIGFVGSLPPSDHAGLLAIPASRYLRVHDKRYLGLTCVDTTVTALGVTRRAVLTHSPTLHTAQSRGFDQTLAKARRKLLELQATLDRGHTRRARAAVESEIATICRPRWVSQVLTTTLTGQTPAELALTFRTNTGARSRLEDKLFGKRIPVSYTHLRAHETVLDLVCRLLLEKKKNKNNII